MELNLGTAEWLVIGLCVIIGIDFLIGNWINNQRAMTTMAWIRKGISTFGEVKALRYSVPTAQGIQIKVDPPDGSPFKKMEATLVLEHRENLPYWLFQLLQGKRDTLTFALDLFASPGKDAIQSNAWIAQLKSQYPELFLEITFQSKHPHLIFQTRLSSLLQTDPTLFFNKIQENLQ
jgi:hypothetical protein